MLVTDILFLYLSHVIIHSFSARSITFLAKVMKSTLHHLVHASLLLFLGLSRSIESWTVGAGMPLRDHLVHSFV